jgi:cytochrome oxidase Cu insertion factor (SCO1/SenC/PrrC family)
MGEEKEPQDFWQSVRKWWLLIIGCAALVVITTMLAMVGLTPREPKHIGPPAPGFVLRDQQGRLTSLAQFRGKAVLLTFIDPECTQICPLTTQSMLDAVRMLGPDAASRVQLLGINVNVEKAKVADVDAYTHSHDLEGHWRFLTGSPAQLKKVWHDYYVYVARTPDGDVEHTAVTYLIDPGGDERATFTTSMSYAAVSDEAEAFAHAIALVLPSYPALALPEQPPPQNQPQVAAEKARLAPIGPQRTPVAFGHAHPHLMVFFAGWLGKQTNLANDLTPLDHYAVLARQHNWPTPVAVDEFTTEPSAAEARQVLIPLSGTLHTPIVEDASGQLADYYRVNELPWYVLCSDSGKIVWFHDGWLDDSALNRDVRRALASANKEGS